MPSSSRRCCPALRGREERAGRGSRPRSPSSSTRLRRTTSTRIRPTIISQSSPQSARRADGARLHQRKKEDARSSRATCTPVWAAARFLTPDRFTDAGVGNIANAGNYEPGKHKYYGRFNQGVVTINLPDVALSSGGNIENSGIFLKTGSSYATGAALPPRPPARHALRRRAHPLAVRCLRPTQEGRTHRLPALRRLLHHLLGYAGLCECVKYMTGKSHTDPAATPFALSIMQKMNDKCKGGRLPRTSTIPLRHAAGVHDLQVCQVPAKAASASSRA